MPSEPLNPAVDLPAPTGEARWVVVHTRPRAEKKLAEFGRQQKMTVFLPLHQRLHRYGARERVFSSPLFAGYVFCLADPAGRRLLQQNRHAANVLEVLDQAQLVQQLRQIQSALCLGDLLEVMPYLESGHRVRVLAGPLRGAEGIVLRVKGKSRIVLNVDMIRESVAVEVDSAMLGPI
jgi:transcriptional antiterminator RfaH